MKKEIDGFVILSEIETGTTVFAINKPKNAVCNWVPAKLITEIPEQKIELTRSEILKALHNNIYRYKGSNTHFQHLVQSLGFKNE